MSLTFNGTSSSLQFAGKLITGYPFAIFGWEKPRIVGQSTFAVCQGTADNAEEIGAYVDGGNTGKLRGWAASGGGNGTVNSTSSVATTWQPWMISADSATSWNVRLANGEVVNGNPAKSPVLANMVRFVIGARAGTLNFWFDGDQAEVAVWQGTIPGQSEYDSLVAGAFPETILPSSLVEHFSLLIQAATQTGDKGHVLTNGASTTQGATHPITRTADTTAPTLSSPTGTALTPTTASASVSTDEGAGTIWCYTLPAASAAPDAATVKASGTSQAVTATGVQTFATRTGLSPTTDYKNYFVQVDAATTPNTSAVVASASFTTPAANAAPTFPGNIANITGTGGTAITPVDVHTQFSDTDTLTYSASPAGTAWPSGLVINSSTGVISGTVATSTTTGLKVRATDTASQTVDSNAFNVTISAPASTVTGVTVSPAAPTVSGNATQQFTATVAGTGSPSQTVNWAASAGSINSAGLFTAPAATASAQTITITATSAQDNTKSGTATVTVPASTVTGVTVSPATATVTGGATQTFTATVAGTDSPSQAVTWTTSAGSINSSGVLTALATTSSTQTVTVTATSVQNNTKSGTATVTVPASATQPTFTPTPTGKNINGGARASVPCRVAVYDKATDALVGIKTGLTSTSAGLPPPFQLASGATAGSEYLCKVVATADNTDLGFFWCTPA
jgi:hypothetical protein